MLLQLEKKKLKRPVRKAFAVGADRGIHVIKLMYIVEPLAVSKLVTKVVEKKNLI